MANFTE